MNPYESLPNEAFWKPSVSNINCLEISNLWSPKFKIEVDDKIATYGSCFAQYIGQALEQRGFCWNKTEKGPEGLNEASLRDFNYGIFSSRTGNIYTVSLLKQWLHWALEIDNPPDEVWTNNQDRYIDPFRPRIEPEGFKSREELFKSRKYCIEKFRESVENSSIFVFTLGLTESWRHKKSNYIYPLCPGTAGGEFDKDSHEFHQESYEEIKKDLSDVIKLCKKVNKNIKFILTVSPVPLTATYSGRHVLVATSASKSILRAVCEKFTKNNIVDYFPSYEIINSAVFQGMFFNPNKRTVSMKGVSFVMDSFFDCMMSKYKYRDLKSKITSFENAVCEEEILEAFSK